MFPIRLSCPPCGWSELCDMATAVHHLGGAGMLRRSSGTSPAEVAELLTAALPRLKCPDCQQAGLEASSGPEGPARVGLGGGVLPWEGDGWPEARLCDECESPIHPERLEVFPDTRLCTACQRRDETGAPNLAEDVYCPRCGAPMLVKPTSGHGVTRYVWVCSQYPACRSREA